jgi:hypothetical protein
MKYILTFFGGFLVMLLEMCAFRVLTVNFGSSIYVTGTLLTLIMMALSLGYLCGGWLSSRESGRESGEGDGAKLLGMLLAGCGIYVGVVHLMLSETVLEVANGVTAWLPLESVWVSVLPPALSGVMLYGIPMFLLSQISPLVVHHSDQRLGVGQKSGLIMSLSTVGSIFGTLLTSYAALPFLGVKNTLRLAVVLCSVLIPLAFLQWEGSRLRLKTGWKRASLVGLIGWSGFFLGGTPLEPGVLFFGETRYGTAKIIQARSADGEELIKYKPSRYYIHSELFPQHPLKAQFSLSYFTPVLHRRPKSYLILGAAVGSAIRQIQAFDPQASITGVEIDGEVLTLGQQYFGLTPSPRVKLVQADAKMFLLSNHQKFDHIIVDVYSGEFIPPHCITLEFFKLISEAMSENGTLYVNSNMFDFPYGDPEKLGVFSPLHHLEATLFQAGFKSLVENSLFHGIYASKSEDFESTLFQEMQASLNQPQLDVNLKAALAGNLLKMIPVDRRLARLRAYDNDWVPEHLIQRKTNLAQFTGVVMNEVQRPDWLTHRAAFLGTPDQGIGAISFDQLFIRKLQSQESQAIPLSRPQDCDLYFKQLAQFIDQHGPPARLEMARYFSLECDFSTLQASVKTKGEKWVYAYSEGMYALRVDAGEPALELLSSVL